MTRDEVKLAMSVAVSAILLAAGLYVVLSNDGGADLQKAATGWIGLILGYWLQ